MKVLVIGASGTIGSAICKDLKRDSEILTASFSSGEYKVDMASEESIKNLFQQTGELDAIVCAASRGVVFKEFSKMQVQDYANSLQQKLLGQLSLLVYGVDVLRDNGSVTLTTGCMNRDFVAGGSAASMVNSAVEGLVQAAALDLPRGIRVNVVSPDLLEESAEKYKDLCPGFEPVSSARVARAYRKSVYGIETGKVIRVCG